MTNRSGLLCSLMAKAEQREVRRIYELVEKVDTELTATTNRARNAPKPVCLVADHGRKRAPREFSTRCYLLRTPVNRLQGGAPP